MAVGAIAGSAGGQCQPQWLPGTGVPGVDLAPQPAEENAAAAVTWDPDGPGPLPPALVVGGEFGIAGSAEAANVALWDGQAWRALGEGLPSGCAALVIRDGDIYAGGLVWGVRRWTGVRWEPVGQTLTVRDLIVHQGQLVAAGESGVRTWGSAGWSQLTAVGGVSSATAYALATYNNDLIVGGRFANVGGVPANCIAGWNGTSWYPLGAGTGGTVPDVRALAVHGGVLFAGGTFTTAGGAPAPRVARWNGVEWQALGSGPGGSVFDLTVFRGDVVATGLFTGDPRGIARWDGSAWQPLATGLAGVGRLVAVHQDELVAGGSFHSAGGVGASHVARWDGKAWRAYGESGFNDDVNVLLAYGEDLFAGGEFLLAGDQAAAHVAGFDGVGWYALGVGTSGPVKALAEYDQELVVGGTFSSAGGVTVGSIASWDGQRWRGLGTGVSSGDSVHALAVYKGDLVAGGWFWSAGGAPANNIASWDGKDWRPLGAGVSGGSPPYVHALAAYNGDLFVGGGFASAGQSGAGRLARWDGTAWYSMGTLTAAPGFLLSVEALTVFRDQLVVGGNFIGIGGLAAAGLAGWNGSNWSTLGTGGPTYAPQAFCVLDGHLIVGGFASVPGHVGRWDGKTWEIPWPSGLSQGANPLAVWRDGLAVGGVHVGPTGHVTARVVRWGCPGCYPDCDGSGVLDINDYVCFQTRFTLGDPYADCDGDGVHNVNDYVCFQTSFALGC